MNLKMILIYYSTYLPSFMLEMKALKSLDAYNQLTSGWISDVAVFMKKVGGLCEDRQVLEESREQQRGIEGVVTGGGDGSEMETVTGGGKTIYTQYRCQRQHVGVCMPHNVLTSFIGFIFLQLINIFLEFGKSHMQ